MHCVDVSGSLETLAIPGTSATLFNKEEETEVCGSTRAGNILIRSAFVFGVPLCSCPDNYMSWIDPPVDLVYKACFRLSFLSP